MTGKQKIVACLTIMIIAILLCGSLTAIFSEDGGKPYRAVTLRGEEIRLYGGSGPYQYDTVKKALMQRAFDLYYLIAGVPILIAGLVLYLRKSMAGYSLSVSTFMFLIYNFLISSIGIAYNAFFLIYIVMLILSSFALTILLGDFSIIHVRDEILPKLPHKTISIFLITIASYFIISWLVVDLSSMVSGKLHPYLAHYTTAEQNVTDLAVFAPLAITGAVLFLKRKPLGAILSIGLLLMSAHTLTALSMFTCMEASFNKASILSIEFPIIFIALMALLLAWTAIARLKGLKFRV
jgi:hypothetical protein